VNDPIISGGTIVAAVFGLIALLLLGWAVFALVYFVYQKKTLPAKFAADWDRWTNYHHTFKNAKRKQHTDYYLTDQDFEKLWLKEMGTPAPEYVERDKYEADEYYLTSGVVAGIIGLIIGGILAFGMYPYHAVYHQWSVKEGTVQQAVGLKVDSTQNDGLYKDYLILVNGENLTCSDTQCSGLHEGDYVKLRCKPNYRWAGAPTNVCSFVSSRRS
jgi:hypothetical protein